MLGLPRWPGMLPGTLQGRAPFEGVLLSVSQPHRSFGSKSGPSAPGPRRARNERLRKRAARRLLARAAEQIENSAAHQRSLQQVLELDARFRRALQPEQRECWLEFEEALLEHSARLNRTYFEAGVEAGSSLNLQRRFLRHQRELEVVAALARVLAKLTRRWGG